MYVFYLGGPTPAHPKASNGMAFMMPRKTCAAAQGYSPMNHTSALPEQKDARVISDYPNQ